MYTLDEPGRAEHTAGRCDERYSGIVSSNLFMMSLSPWTAGVPATSRPSARRP